MSNEADGFRCRMIWALVGLRIEDDGFIFASMEYVCAVPSENDQLVLRQIVFASYDSVILYPNDELGESDVQFIHSVLQGKQHLVGIENVDAVFLRESRKDGCEPVLREVRIFNFRVDVVICDNLVRLER